MLDPKISIRTAHAADAETLASMRWRFRTSLDKPCEPQPEFVARMTPWLIERMTGPWKAWMAVDDEQPVGTVFLHAAETLPNPVDQPETMGHITSLYVEPDFRGSGVGGALLDAAIAHCRQTDVDSLVLWPQARSRALYEERGFLARAEIVALTIRRPGQGSER